MMIHWTDFDRSLGSIDEMRRRMERMFDELGRGPSAGARVGAPRAALYDTEDEFVLLFELPGVGQEDVELSIHQDVLTLRAERPLEVPEGYRAHRQERAARTWTRSVPLPGKVDTEKTKAKLQDGVLEIRMVKRPEAKPRRIQVQA